MKKLLALVSTTALLAGCSDAQTAQRALENFGFAKIEITGYRLFGCGGEDSFHTGFKALDGSGHEVTGVVCSSWLKGATVRLD